MQGGLHCDEDVTSNCGASLGIPTLWPQNSLSSSRVACGVGECWRTTDDKGHEEARYTHLHCFQSYWRGFVVYAHCWPASSVT